MAMRKTGTAGGNGKTHDCWKRTLSVRVPGFADRTISHVRRDQFCDASKEFEVVSTGGNVWKANVERRTYVIRVKTSSSSADRGIRKLHDFKCLLTPSGQRVCEGGMLLKLTLFISLLVLSTNAKAAPVPENPRNWTYYFVWQRPTRLYVRRGWVVAGGEIWTSRHCFPAVVPWRRSYGTNG